MGSSSEWGRMKKSRDEGYNSIEECNQVIKQVLCINPLSLRAAKTGLTILEIIF